MISEIVPRRAVHERRIGGPRGRGVGGSDHFRRGWAVCFRRWRRCGRRDSGCGGGAGRLVHQRQIRLTRGAQDLDVGLGRFLQTLRQNFGWHHPTLEHLGPRPRGPLGSLRLRGYSPLDHGWWHTRLLRVVAGSPRRERGQPAARPAPASAGECPGDSSKNPGAVVSSPGAAPRETDMARDQSSRSDHGWPTGVGLVMAWGGPDGAPPCVPTPIP